MFGKMLIDKKQHAILLREALQIQDENLSLKKELRQLKEKHESLIKRLRIMLSDE